MNKKLIIIILGVALLVFGATARASGLTGTCDSTSVQCDLQINNMTVCNDNGFTQTFYPLVSGEVPSWVKALPESVTLQAGECTQLEVYTISPCYQEPGQYSATVDVTDSDGQPISCSIELNQGHFVDMDFSPEQQTVTQCEEASYKIELENNTIVPNQQLELVNLSVSGIDPSWVNLETSQIIVEKGEPATVNLSLLAPCDQEIGNYDFEVKSSLFNPNFYSTKKGTLTIVQGQGLQIDVDDGFGEGTSQNPLKACIEAERTVEITLKNTGNKDDTIDISLEGPDWARLSETNIDIQKGEEKKIQLTFEKTNDTQTEYPIKLTFTSTIFKFSATKELTVSLQDCFNASLEFPVGQENICKDEENNLTFRLKNDRENPLDLKLEVEGINASLEEDTVSLGAFEEKEITVKVDATGLASEGTVKKTPLFLEVLFDASGSMNQKIEGQRKIDIAKHAIIAFTNEITPIDIGLRVFGHKEECSDSELLEPINQQGIIDIPQKIKEFAPTGNTPLAKTLEQSLNDFAGKEGDKFVILVSDGKESCNGDTKASAQKLNEKGITVYAIGFDIDETGKRQLDEIVNITGGQYFDARNANELINVLLEITRKLDIQKSRTVQKNFTVKATSENFSLEKDFMVSVSDCHNIAVFTPELNVCTGITGKETATIINLGTKEQQLEINATPGFVKPMQSTINLGPGETAFVEIEFTPQTGDSEDEFTFSASSENVSVNASSGINYLEEAACTGFDMVILQPEFVGRIGEGERRKILLINLGKTNMDLSLKGDQTWIYFEPNNLTLKQNEVGFANFYVTPPFDLSLLNEDAVALVTATNNFGFEVTKEAKLVVTGPSFGLVPENIEVKSIDATTLPEGEAGKDYEITFTLSNTSERTIEIREITIPGMTTSTATEKSVLKTGEQSTVKVLVDLGERTGKIMLPLLITTTDGSISREIEIETAPPKEEEPTGEEAVGPTGLPTLAEIATTSIIGLIILALFTIPVIIFFQLKLSQKQKEKQEQEKKEDAQAEPVEQFTEQPQKEKKAKAKAKKTNGGQKKSSKEINKQIK